MAEMQQRGLVIINDHQFLSDLLGGEPKDHGFELIESFTQAEIGLAYILAHPPDLVIIDRMLPIMRTSSNSHGHWDNTYADHQSYYFERSKTGKLQ